MAQIVQAVPRRGRWLWTALSFIRASTIGAEIDSAIEKQGRMTQNQVIRGLVGSFAALFNTIADP